MRALSKPRRTLVLLIALPVSCATLAHAESIDALYEKAKLEKTWCSTAPARPAPTTAGSRTSSSAFPASPSRSPAA